jgi:competence protein ComEA
MLNAKAFSLLFAVFACFSIATQAAETASSEVSKPAAGETASVPTSKININTADAETLEHELIGIGAVKAKAIVEHRDANGPFTSIDELLEVKGIGSATLDKNRDKLTAN